MILRLVDDPRRLTCGEYFDGHVNLNRVRFCSLLYLRAMIRLAFETRQSRANPYVVLHHKPSPEEGMKLYGTTGGMVYEGAILDSWTSDGEGENAEVGFTIDGRHHSVPVAECVELQTF